MHIHLVQCDVCYCEVSQVPKSQALESWDYLLWHLDVRFGHAGNNDNYFPHCCRKCYDTLHTAVEDAVDLLRRPNPASTLE